MHTTDTCELFEEISRFYRDGNFVTALTMGPCSLYFIMSFFATEQAGLLVQSLVDFLLVLF